MEAMRLMQILHGAVGYECLIFTIKHMTNFFIRPTGDWYDDFENQQKTKR